MTIHDMDMPDEHSGKMIHAAYFKIDVRHSAFV